MCNDHNEIYNESAYKVNTFSHKNKAVYTCSYLEKIVTNVFHIYCNVCENLALEFESKNQSVLLSKIR